MYLNSDGQLSSEILDLFNIVKIAIKNAESYSPRFSKYTKNFQMTESNTKILFFMGIYINLNKTGLSLLQELFD